MAPDDPRDADAWARVNDLFHRALEVSADRRMAFVAAEAATDAALRAEVSSLLAAHERAGSFIERPAARVTDLRASDQGPRLAPGQQVGRYRIERPIGEGGMGVVYLAEDTTLGRTVALKALPPQHMADETRRERLRREARAAAMLSHRGIATVYALEEIDGNLYIASQYVDGETLRDRLTRGPMATADAVALLAQVADALAAAHARGIVHRDLKPENLICGRDGLVRILDFGLARLRDLPPAARPLTIEAGALGTPAYMSPEQIRGEPVDGRSDLFSLGVVACELLTGTHPFLESDPAATIARVLEAAPPPLTIADRDHATRRLGTIVSKCLEKDPEHRFQSAVELAAALNGDVHLPIAPRHPRDDQPPARAMWWWQFHQVTAAVSYVLLLIPLWRMRDVAAGPQGTLLFLAGLTAVVLASTLRLHLWFAVQFYRAEWEDQQRRTAGWIRAADLLFVAVLAGEGLLVEDTHARAATLLIAAAAATLVSFVFIEPATTRAAFGHRFPRDRG